MNDVFSNNPVYFRAYGPPGNHGPIPVSTHLVGGTRNGQHMRTDPSQGYYLIVPKLPKVRYYVEPGLPSPADSIEQEIYVKRWRRPHIMAAPVAYWVKEGLSDQHADALLKEWDV